MSRVGARVRVGAHRQLDDPRQSNRRLRVEAIEDETGAEATRSEANVICGVRNEDSSDRVVGSSGPRGRGVLWGRAVGVARRKRRDGREGREEAGQEDRRDSGAMGASTRDGAFALTERGTRVMPLRSQ